VGYIDTPKYTEFNNSKQQWKSEHVRGLTAERERDKETER